MEFSSLWNYGPSRLAAFCSYFKSRKGLQLLIAFFSSNNSLLLIHDWLQKPLLQTKNLQFFIMINSSMHFIQKYFWESEFSHAFIFLDRPTKGQSWKHLISPKFKTSTTMNSFHEIPSHPGPCRDRPCFFGERVHI